MPVPKTSDVLSMLGALLDGTHLADPDELAAVVSEAASHAGWELTVFLADLEQRGLHRLPEPGRSHDRQVEIHAIDGTLAGRCFRLCEPVHVQRPTEFVWVPLVDGVDRLGVARLVMRPGEAITDPRTEAAVRWVTYQIAHLIASKAQFADYFHLVRRTREKTAASELIWSMLPPLTIACHGVAIAGGLEPRYSSAGDFFDYAIDDGMAHVAISDATGHDLQSSVIGAMVLAGYRAARRRGVDLDQMAAEIDAVLLEFGPAMYATAVLGCLDLRAGVFRYVNAGHPAPLLLREGKVVRTLDGGRRMLLGFERVMGAVATEQLEAGDWLVFFTDGVIEARDPHGRFFGVDRLVDVIERCAADGTNAAETLRRVTHSVLDHQRQILQDDATLVVVQWKTGLERELTATAEAEGTPGRVPPPMTSNASDARPENSGDKSVQSIPLDTEDGGTVVIEQQNVGPDNQVGGGEFKNTDEHKTPDEAAAEQEGLESDEPIESGPALVDDD